jgi:hypothetical protein
MRIPNDEVRAPTRKIPELRFEDQSLTSFSGLVAFQALFNGIGFAERLRRCTAHLRSSAAFARHRILLLLVVHLLLGWRRLRDLDYYRDDPLVLRIVGWNRLPSVPAVSRALSQFDEKAYDQLRELSRRLVVERISKENVPTITVDFDGSVLSTKGRCKEGTAIGYNHKKGQRSYYPLFATVSQTGQVLDVLHRAGNVHDSNGAWEFMVETFSKLREDGYRGRLETRFDGAHFNEGTCLWLREEGVEFTGSVPFERLAQLKEKVENRKRWRSIDEEWSYFEERWSPKKWFTKMRFIFYRHRVKKPKKGPIQLDFFEPVSREFEYKVVVTSKTTSAKNVLHFHNGRGSQEGLFAELKTQASMEYMPSKTLIGNKIYLASAALAHNLNRELQMRTTPRRPERSTVKRAALWVFEQLDTFRKRVIQRAGRLTRPQGVLTLTCSANEKTARDLVGIVSALETTG